MDTTMIFVCYANPTVNLADQEGLVHLLDSLVQNGFFLYTEAEDHAVHLAWLHYAKPEVLKGDTEEQIAKRQLAAPYLQQITQPGITEKLRQEVLAFTASPTETLKINAEGTSSAGGLHNFSFELTIEPKQTYLTLHYTTGFFSRKKTTEEGVRSYEQWLAICKACYTFAQAIYAYELDITGVMPGTDPEYIAQCQPWMLYEVNFFGPEMVANLGGLPYVLKTPAQIVRPLENGGAMVLPEINWYPDVASQNYSWAKAAKYLHVAKPDFIQDDDDDDE